MAHPNEQDANNNNKSEDAASTDIHDQFMFADGNRLLLEHGMSLSQKENEAYRKFLAAAFVVPYALAATLHEQQEETPEMLHARCAEIAFQEAQQQQQLKESALSREEVVALLHEAGEMEGSCSTSESE